MTINWDEFDSEIDLIIENSAEVTDEKLASSISSITRMTDEEVKELFPSPADVKKLTELMKIVKSSQNRNEKINSIVAKSEELGGVILSLLQKFS
jgi:hypothetical protein